MKNINEGEISMAFRYESRNSSIINAQDIMGKSNEENFENLIKQYKERSLINIRFRSIENGNIYHRA